MDWLQVTKELIPGMRVDNLDTCIERVSEILRTIPLSPYHIILDLDFTNSPQAVAAYFDTFVEETSKQFKVKALYTETNGFYINPDRWYFEAFGYKAFGGHGDLEWLAWCDAESKRDVMLTGMEKLQAVYRHHTEIGYWNQLNNEHAPEVKQTRTACDFCDLLVVFRFQDLIRRSAPFMKNVYVPLLATSHEFDFVYAVTPAPEI